MVTPPENREFPIATIVTQMLDRPHCAAALMGVLYDAQIVWPAKVLALEIITDADAL